jgi:diadenosine tetraphosphate (Ap4A) HIT family hydrolase
MTCSLCQRVQLAQAGQYPYLIHEFEHSYLMLGEHQFYPGYCVVVLKDHHKEMTDIPQPMQVEFFQELMLSSKAIERVMGPKKMNMCSLGNVVPHVHWHFFPRFESDPQFFDPPWLRMKEFDQAQVTPLEAQQTIEKIRLALK